MVIEYRKKPYCLEDAACGLNEKQYQVGDGDVSENFKGRLTLERLRTPVANVRR